MRAVQTFEVSLKAFILRNGRALFVREADTGWWELPGGRIDVGEEWEPHAVILAREIREELGAAFQPRFGPDVVTWTRQRPTDGGFVFLVARIGQVAGGEPTLSEEHSEFAWLDREMSLRLQFPPRSGYQEAIAALWRIADARSPRD